LTEFEYFYIYRYILIKYFYKQILNSNKTLRLLRFFVMTNLRVSRK